MYPSVCLLVLFAISASGFTFREVEVKCRKEADISDKATFIHSDFDVSPRFDTKCYEACIRREAGELDNNGIISPAAIELYSSFLNDSELKEIKSCANQTVEDFCQTASKSIQCYYSLLNKQSFKAYNKCLRETNTSAETIKTSSFELLFKNPDTICYAACIMRETGYLNADGTVHSAQIKYSTTACKNCDENIKIFNSCNNQMTGNFCETAVKSYECLVSAQFLFELSVE